MGNHHIREHKVVRQSCTCKIWNLNHTQHINFQHPLMAPRKASNKPVKATSLLYYTHPSPSLRKSILSASGRRFPTPAACPSLWIRAESSLQAVQLNPSQQPRLNFTSSCSVFLGRSASRKHLSRVFATLCCFPCGKPGPSHRVLER